MKRFEGHSVRGAKTMWCPKSGKVARIVTVRTMEMLLNGQGPRHECSFCGLEGQEEPVLSGRQVFAREVRGE